MSTAAFALLAAVTALAAVVALGAHMRRANRSERARLTHGLHEMSERLDGLARELALTVEKVRDESLRAQIVGSMGRTLDLDEVVTRCAEAASSLPGVAAAVVTVEVDGASLRAAVGIDPDSLYSVAGPPGSTPVRAVGLSYHYAERHQEPGAMLSAVAVPIVSERGGLGFLTVFGRDEEPPVTGSDFKTLEAIAQHAGPAIENARRHAALQPEVPDTPPELPNRELLHETLALEVARAHRRARSLAVCVFDVDDLRAANARIGPVATDALLAEVARLLGEALRPGDIAYRCGGDAFAVVLPDSSRIDAEAMFARAQAALQRLPHPPGPVPSLSAGIAELKPDDDGVSLFDRAERSLRRAKQAGKGTAA